MFPKTYEILLVWEYKIITEFPVSRKILDMRCQVRFVCSVCVCVCTTPVDPAFLVRLFHKENIINFTYQWHLLLRIAAKRLLNMLWSYDQLTNFWKAMVVLF